MKKGLTLIEIVISMGFLAFLLIPVAQLFVTQHIGQTFQDHQAQAIQQATAIMEEIKEKDFEDLQSTTDTPTASFGIRDDSAEISSNRKTWDDLDDYHNLVVTTNTLRTSVSVVYLEDVTSNVSYTWVSTENPTDFKLVSVNAQFPGNGQIEIIRKFANFYNP